MNAFQEINIPKRKSALSRMEIYFYCAVGLSLAIVAYLFKTFLAIEFNEGFIKFIGIILMLTVFPAIWFYYRNKMFNSWKKIAANAGLSYTESCYSKNSLLELPRISGIYQGFAVQVEQFTRGFGRFDKKYTSIKLTLNGSTTESIGVARSGSKFLNKKVLLIKLGCDEFDNKLQIRSTSEQITSYLFSSDIIKKGLIEIRSQAPEMYLSVKNNQLYYHEENNIVDENYMIAVINLLIEIAENIPIDIDPYPETDTGSVDDSFLDENSVDYSFLDEDSVNTGYSAVKYKAVYEGTQKNEATISWDQAKKKKLLIIVSVLFTVILFCYCLFCMKLEEVIACLFLGFPALILFYGIIFFIYLELKN